MIWETINSMGCVLLTVHSYKTIFFIPCVIMTGINFWSFFVLHNFFKNTQKPKPGYAVIIHIYSLLIIVIFRLITIFMIKFRL